MKHSTVLFLLSFLLIYNLLQAMDQESNNAPKAAQTIAEKLESVPADTDSVKKRRRDIFFKAVATIKVGFENRNAEKIHEEDHPFMTNSYYHQDPPYSGGNGGLLNPALRNFEIKKESIDDAICKGVRIEITGHVAADGIAPYKFYETHYGDHYNQTSIFDGKTYYKGEYKISVLEEAILGFLKERTVDRQIIDLTDVSFDLDLGKMTFADKFISCIKREWTSKQDEQDNGLRTPHESELIQRHFARSTFWPSRWHEPQHMRTGEYIRTRHLNGESDPQASIELNEFKIEVKKPGNEQEKGCAAQ